MGRRDGAIMCSTFVAGGRALAGGFTVGDWTVAPELNSLERDGQTVRVEPKIMQVLVTLAEHPGEVVSKEFFFNGFGQKRLSPMKC
jgi:DNA-binding response OmpR family regulator